jgi:sec-independent protein translocase protein TatA
MLEAQRRRSGTNPDKYPQTDVAFSQRSPAMLGEILGPDLLIVVGLIVLLFGGSQLPKLARGLGAAQREFKRGLAGDTDEDANK